MPETARYMTTIAAELTDRLRLAVAYIDEHGFAQDFEQTNDGQVCLTGAIRLCSPQPGDAWLIRQVLRRLGHGEEWNDHPVRVAEDVTAYMTGLDITDEMLEDTFGPDWLRVVMAARASGGNDWAAMRYADLSYADLTGTYLRGADMWDANLSHAILRDADLTYADLSCADMTGADVTGADGFNTDDWEFDPVTDLIIGQVDWAVG